MFECKHPFDRLAVEKGSTEGPPGKDFTEVTHHLFCQKCSTKLDLKYSKTNGGVAAFFGRKED